MITAECFIRQEVECPNCGGDGFVNVAIAGDLNLQEQIACYICKGKKTVPESLQQWHNRCTNLIQQLLTERDCLLIFEDICSKYAHRVNNGDYLMKYSMYLNIVNAMEFMLQKCGNITENERTEAINRVTGVV